MINWQWDWRAFDRADKERYFLDELRSELELNPSHALYGKDVRILGWREDRQWADFIIHLPAEDRYAYVHLTWSKETDPQWPYCELLNGVDALDGFLKEWGQPE